MENVNKAERIVEYFFVFFFKFFFLNLSFCSFIFFWYRSQVFLGRKIKLRRQGGQGKIREKRQLANKKTLPQQKKKVKKVPLGKTTAQESIPHQGEELGRKGGCDEESQGGQAFGRVLLLRGSRLQGKRGTPTSIRKWRNLGAHFGICMTDLIRIPRELYFQRHALSIPILPRSAFSYLP